MRALVAALPVLLLGCLEAGVVVCDDGRLCPAGSICRLNGCVSEDLLEPCLGHDDGDPCVLAGVSGFCDDGICRAPTCGDGVVQPPEACDDGDLESMDGCRSDCGSDESCGNGITDFAVGEQCDCGTDAPAPGCIEVNSADGGLCNVDCRPHCGDGDIDPGELCDAVLLLGDTCLTYGFDRGHLSCSAVCAPSFAGCGRIGWVAEDVPATPLHGVWGGGGAWFAVGDGGLVLRRTSAGWEVVDAGTTSPLRAVWGSGPADVYAVGVAGTVVHWNGAAWSSDAPPGATEDFHAVWGSGPDDVWVAGASAPDPLVIWHRDASAWTSYPAGVAADVNALTGAEAEAWAVGDQAGNSACRRWDGGAWQTFVEPPGNDEVTGAWAAGPDELFIVDLTRLARYSAGAWTTIEAMFGAAAVWGRAADDLYVAGYQLITHRLARSTATPFPGVTESYTSIAGDDDEIYVVGEGIRRYTGAAWSATNVSTTTPVWAVWATSEEHAYVNHDLGRIDELLGPAATGHAGASPLSVQDLWAAAEDDVTAVGNGIRHWNGSAWSAPFTGTTGGLLRGVWGVASGDVFAVGASGRIFRCTGTVCVPMDPAGATSDFTAVFGVAADDVMAVGTGGTVRHWNGFVWEVVTTGSTDDLEDVWSPGGGEWFAVGAFGVMLHLEAGVWAPIDTGTSRRLNTIWGSGPDDMFVGGDDGLLLHHDGVAIDPVRAPAAGDIVGIGGSAFSLYVGIGQEVWRLDRSHTWAAP